VKSLDFEFKKFGLGIGVDALECGVRPGRLPTWEEVI
jgi:hypothetical protein